MKSDDLDKLTNFLSNLSLRRVSLGVLFCLCTILLYTMYENRQTIYTTVVEMKLPRNGKYELQLSTFEQEELLREFLKTHSNVIQISVLDADPIKNSRTPVKTVYKDLNLKSLIENLTITRSSSGPLFSSNEKSNQQIVRLLSGEISCNPGSEGFYSAVFPEIQKYIVYTCRVPVPPAYGKVTGWISIHFKDWPVEDYEKLKYEMLKLADAYYTLELARYN